MPHEMGDLEIISVAIASALFGTIASMSVYQIVHHRDERPPPRCSVIAAVVIPFLALAICALQLLLTLSFDLATDSAPLRKLTGSLATSLRVISDAVLQLRAASEVVKIARERNLTSVSKVGQAYLLWMAGALGVLLAAGGWAANWLGPTAQAVWLTVVAAVSCARTVVVIWCLRRISSPYTSGDVIYLAVGFCLPVASVAVALVFWFNQSLDFLSLLAPVALLYALATTCFLITTCYRAPTPKSSRAFMPRHLRFSIAHPRQGPSALERKTGEVRTMSFSSTHTNLTKETCPYDGAPLSPCSVAPPSDHRASRRVHGYAVGGGGFSPPPPVHVPLARAQPFGSLPLARPPSPSQQPEPLARTLRLDSDASVGNLSMAVRVDARVRPARTRTSEFFVAAAMGGIRALFPNAAGPEPAPRGGGAPRWEDPEPGRMDREAPSPRARPEVTPAAAGLKLTASASPNRPGLSTERGRASAICAGRRPAPPSETPTHSPGGDAPPRLPRLEPGFGDPPPPLSGV